MKRKICYNVSTVERDSLSLLTAFVSHWLSGFCSDEYEIELREDLLNLTNIFLDVTFSSEKDRMVAVLKDFPSQLAKFRVIH